MSLSSAGVLTTSSNIVSGGTITGGGLLTTGGSIVIPDAGTIGSASDTNAIAISSAGVVTISTNTDATNSTSGALIAHSAGIADDLYVGDGLFVAGAITGSGVVQGTTITATTAFVPDASDGAALGSASLEFSDLFLADAAVINFGADQDINITHVADTGLTTNGSFTASGTIQGTTITATTAFVPDASDGATLGSSTLQFSDLFIADGGEVKFGDDQDVLLRHDHNSGLIIDRTDQSDNAPVSLTLSTAETDIQADDVIGKINFQAPDEGTGTDAVLISAAIQARSEGDFSATANATSIDFMTGASEAATSKMSVTSGGNLTINTDGANIGFGANSEITLTHVHNVGLTLTHTATDDNLPIILQLKSEENEIVANEVIGSLEFAAGDADGTDGATVAAGIHAIAEGTFSASANATKLVFTTGVSETAAASATAKMTLSSAGLLTIADDFMIKDGGTIGVASDADAITIASNGQLTLTQTLIGTALDISGDIDVDGTTNLDIVDIDGAVDMASTLQVDGAITSSAGATITVADNSAALTLVSTDADAVTGPLLDFNRNSSSPADNDDLGYVRFLGENDASESTAYAQMFGSAEDVSDGTEDGSLSFFTIVNGAQVNRIEIMPTEINFNQGGIDLDFRVESNGQANMFYVDGGNDTVSFQPNSGNLAVKAGRVDSTNNVRLEAGGTTSTFLEYRGYLGHIWDVNTTERLRLTGAGRLENKSPSNTGNVLQDFTIDWRNENSAGIMAGIGVVRTNNANAPGAFVIRTSTDVDSSSNNSDGEISEKFRVAANGDLTATDTSIASNSDSRLKENIADFTYDLTKFKALKTKTFDWKQPELHGDKSGVRGFVAQDIEKVDDYWIDEVEVQKDSDDYQYLEDKNILYTENATIPDGKKVGDLEYKARFAKTSKLGQKDSMYVSVINQLIAKIETLETEVQALKDA